MKRDEVVFKNSIRKIRQSKMILHHKASDIFPLLCPVIEYEWFPHWGCTMVYSESGVAEKNGVFTTKNRDNSEAVWTIITYEPPQLIEFSIVYNLDTVERLSIFLSEPDPHTTELRWVVMNTAYSETSIKEVMNLKNEEFDAFIEERRKEMDYYLKTGTMIGC